MRTGPLIEEINDQDIIENVLIPINKQSASFMDDIRSLSSEKEVQNKRAKIDKEIEEVIEGEGDEGKYEDETGDEDESQKQILSCVLGMLSAILTLGKASRSFKEEEALKQLLWPLQIIAYRESDIELSKLSTDVSLMLLTRSCNHTVAREKANSHVMPADYDKNYEVQTLGSRISKGGVAVEISCNEYTQPVHVGVSSDRNSNHAEFVVHPIASSTSSTSSSSTSSSSSSSSSSPSTFTVSLLQLLNEYCSSPEPYVRAMGLHYITTAIGDNTQVLYNLVPILYK